MDTKEGTFKMLSPPQSSTKNSIFYFSEFGTAQASGFHNSPRMGI
jgi:hypothetical protein